VQTRSRELSSPPRPLLRVTAILPLCVACRSEVQATAPKPEDRPTPRHSMGFVGVPGKMILYGGQDAQGHARIQG